MAEPIRKMIQPVVAHEPVQIRRVELPDLSEHGPWLIERLQVVYPHATKPMLWSWLNNILNNNEHLFLYQKNSIALAQVERGFSLQPRPTVRERFVFAQDPANPEHVAQAEAFYADFIRWAKAMDAEVVVLSELSDVAADKLKGIRLFEKTQRFIRVEK